MRGNGRLLELPVFEGDDYTTRREADFVIRYAPASVLALGGPRDLQESAAELAVI